MLQRVKLIGIVEKLSSLLEVALEELSENRKCVTERYFGNR